MTILMKLAIIAMVIGFGSAAIASSNPPWSKITRFFYAVTHVMFFAFLGLVVAIVVVDL